MSSATVAEDVSYNAAQATAVMKIGITKLRELVQRGELTDMRDEVGRGNRLKLRRDECDVYGGRNEKYPSGGLTSLRKFRRQKGRS